MSDTEFYFKRNPPNKPVTVRSTVVIRLPLFNESPFGPDNNNYPSFQSLMHNGTPESFATLLTDGALNKAIKNALLYNYFGYPVTNIKYEKSQKDYKEGSLQFSSQNNNHLKFTQFEVKDGQYGKWIDTLQTVQGILYRGYVSTKGFYQYGLLKPLPDFKDTELDLYNYFDQSGDQQTFSFKEIQENSGLEVDFIKDIYMCLHGSSDGVNTPQSVGGFNSFVEPIGVSPRGSLFYAGTGDPTGPDVEKIAKFGLYEKSSGGKSFVEYEAGGEISDFINDFDYLSAMASWNSPYNPSDKTYARAWLPTGPIEGYLTYITLQPSNPLINYNPNEGFIDLAAGVDDGEVIGDESIGLYEASQISVSDFAQGLDLTWKAPYNQLDSLAFLLGEYQKTDWFVAFPGYGNNGASLENNYSVEFGKYNIASMYKLSPQIEDLLKVDNLDINPLGGLQYYLDDPARTLNAIYPRIFKYVNDIVPTAPLPSVLQEGSVKNVNIIDPSKIGGQQIKFSDILPKFRISADDYSKKLYYNIPEKTSIGYTHVIGDYKISGQELIETIGEDNSIDPAVLEAKNKFVIVTKTKEQRDFLLASKDEFGKADITYSSDPNFLFRSLPSPLSEDFRKSLIQIMDSGANGSGYPEGELDELQKVYKFSDYLCAALYFRLPPHYSNANKDEGVGSQLIKHQPATLKQRAKVHPNIWNAEPKLRFLEGVQADIEGIYGGPIEAGQMPYIMFLGSYINSTFENTNITNTAETFEYTTGNGWNESTVNVPYIEIETNTASNFAFPVWSYDYKALYEVGWKDLSDYDESKNPELSQVFASNPSVKYIKDKGIPDWVRGLRIYPTLDNDTVLTRPDKNSITGTSDADYILTDEDIDEAVNGATSTGDSIVTGYKNANTSLANIAEVSIVKKMMPAVTLVMEPNIDAVSPGNTPFSIETFDSEIENLSSNNKAYVDIRYAVEIDIDEKDLILDMVGQGVFALAGEVGDYEKLGFDIEKLLFKSNGNVTSPSLIDAYGASGFTFEGVYGYDFGSFEDYLGIDAEFCPTFPPSEAEQKAIQVLENSTDEYACTSYICLEGENVVSVQLKQGPGKDAENLGYLKNNTVVKVLKEWVNGKGEFNKILIVDETSTLNGQEGYIHPKYLRPIYPTLSVDKKIFFNQIFDNTDPTKKLTLANTNVVAMGVFAETLIPDWWNDTKMLEGQPYEYRQEGEYWCTVELDYDCIVDEADLKTKIYEAKIKGVKQLLGFYGKQYTEEDVEKLINTYLAVRVDYNLEGTEMENGFHISDRPGDPLMFLVKAGGIYINAFPDRQDSLQEYKKNSNKIISLNTKWYQTHLQQSIYALNSLYYVILSSDYRVPTFNFKKEADRISYIVPYLKRILLANGYETDSQEENIINIGFDSQYRVTFFSYKEKDKEEKLLRIGFDYFSSQAPFVFKNTMALLYRHRQIKDPTLRTSWKKLFNQWLPDPKPKIVPKSEGGGGYPSDSRCSPSLNWNPPPLSQIWEQVAARLDEILDLDPRYDLGSFRFNLLEYFPPCPKPPAGRGLTVMRLLSEIEGETKVFDNLDILNSVQAEVDRIGQYVGDFMSSQQAMDEIRSKIFTLDDLYTFLLNYISPELLYSKICKCFLDLLDIDSIGVPNLEINATGGSGGLNLKPSNIGKDPKELYDVQGPEAEANLFEEREQIQAEDLFCSFCFRVPSVFLRLPSTDILSVLIDAFKKLLEFALAQILLQLIASLLDILLTCPDLECAPGASKVRDYGSQDIGNLFDNNTPDNLPDFLTNCGLLIDGTNITEEDATNMLKEVSDKLTTSEVLGLISGTPTSKSLKVVKRVVSNYPNINDIFTDIGVIENFFACAGDKLEPTVFDDLENDNLENVADPQICFDFNELSRNNILDKCGSLPNQLINIIKDRNLNHDIQKYKEIAKFIRDNDNLSSQMPSLFEDGKGTQGLLSSLSTPTVDKIIEETIDTISIPIATELTKESVNLTRPEGQVLVKQNARLNILYEKGISDFIATAPFRENGADNFTGLYEKLEEPIVNPDTKKEEYQKQLQNIKDIMSNIYNHIYFDPNNFRVSISVGEQSEPSSTAMIKFNPPAEDQTTGEPVYTNNYQVYVYNNVPFYSTPIELSINGGANTIPEEINNYIQNFELKNTDIPEQAQVFGNIITNGIKKIIEEANLEESEVSEQLENLKSIFETDLYINSLGSIIGGITDVVSTGNIMSEYTLDRQNEALSSPVFAGLVLATAYAFAASPLGQAVFGPLGVAAIATMSNEDIFEKMYPNYTKKQLQHLKLAPKVVKENNGTAKVHGLIDFDKVKAAAKEYYNFAKQTDENSEALNMGQLAILNGLISAVCQLFAGEIYSKSVFTLAHYPKELFAEELNGSLISKYATQLMVRYFNNTVVEAGVINEDLDWEEWNQFSAAWQTVISRLISEKSEFTNFNTNGALPGLPGESTSKGDNVVGAGGVDGKIYDVVTGKEEVINSWIKATEYYVKQNAYDPLKFVKSRLKNIKYYNELAADPETNPFDTIAYPKVLEVHDGITSDFSFTDESNLDELTGEEIQEIYDILPTIQPDQIKNYFNTKSDSSLFSAGVTVTDPLAPIKSHFANGKFFYQYYFRIEDWESEEEAAENDGIYVENLVLRKPKGSAESDYNLMGVVNRDGLLKIINNMYPAGENYGLTDWQTKEPINRFFKSIKYGIRFCYGSIQSVNTEIAGQTNKTKELNNSINTIFNTMHQNQKLKEFCKKEKVFKITELDVNLTEYTEEDIPYLLQQKRISHIIPINSQETANIKDFDEFSFSPAAFFEEDGAGEALIIDWSQNRKQLTTILFSKINGTEENSQNLEFKTMFFYCLPVPLLISLFLTFNASIVSTDRNVEQAFSSTKEVIKDIFMSIYNTRGREYWKQTPKSIAKKGGPIGMAVSSIPDKNDL